VNGYVRNKQVNTKFPFGRPNSAIFGDIFLIVPYSHHIFPTKQ